MASKKNDKSVTNCTEKDQKNDIFLSDSKNLENKIEVESHHLDESKGNNNENGFIPQ